MLGDKDKKKIKNEINDTLEWLDDNPKASKKDIKQKLQELEKKVKPYEEKKNARRDVNDFSNGIKRRVNDADDLGNYLTDKEKKKKY